MKVVRKAVGQLYVNTLYTKLKMARGAFGKMPEAEIKPSQPDAVNTAEGKLELASLLFIFRRYF